ncbi:MAG TPA: hypothetical protein VN207_10935 [Ktedonobacteraceae bacterium]|nr:hypothetical protein [Ktedonobacteraceae bacterium]
MNQPDIPKRFRLTLDFAVSINDEILQTSSDEDELDDDEKKALQAQRALFKGLLQNEYGILDELLRKRILEETRFQADYEDLKQLFRVRDLTDELLLEPIVDSLSVEDQTYFQEASEEDKFEDAAGEAIYAIGVDLEAASLTEIEGEE